MKQWILLLYIWETVKFSNLCMLKYVIKAPIQPRLGQELQKVFVKKKWPAHSAVIIMVRPFALKQLNSLILIDTFICLGGLEILHQTATPEVPC